ncbi:MAG: glycosyltransferase family 4 protein, partial [Gemmatimonadota bacterium]
LGVRNGAGEVLYNAVDTRRFTPAAAGRRQSEPYRFLATGKIGNHLFYRLESTIAALREARRSGLNAVLTIAGRIEEEALSRAHALTVQLGLEDAITFTGPYTQQDAPSVYRSADAYVMTKHNDPCPNTVIEALAAGLPVVYSNTGGTPELVGDDAGIAVACREDWEEAHSPAAADLADAFCRVVDRHDEFAAAARRRAVERFDINPWIDRHRAVFERLYAQASRL